MHKACPECRDLKFVERDGKRVTCKCARLEKLRSYFPFIQVKKIKPDILSRSIELIKDIDLEVNFHAAVCALSETEINLFIMNYLLRHSQPAFRIINAYELIDIFLGKHQDFQTILDIEIPTLIILSGYHEFPNKRQDDALLQLFDHYKRMNNHILFLSKREINAILLNYMKENS